MDKKKNTKGLFIVITMLTIVLVVLVIYFIYKSYNRKNIETNINIDVNNEISVLEPSKELKNVIQKYFDINAILYSNSLGLLNELELKDTIMIPDDYEGFVSDKPYDNSYFVKTDILYSDFENAVSKYMTLDLFYNKYPDYVMNKDDMLCIYSDGGSFGNLEVEKFIIVSSDSGTYIYDVSVINHRDDDGSINKLNYRITLINQNGNYVISDCVIK